MQEICYRSASLEPGHSAYTKTLFQVFCHSGSINWRGSFGLLDQPSTTSKLGEGAHFHGLLKEQMPKQHSFFQSTELRHIPEDGGAHPLASLLCSHREGDDLIIDLAETWRGFGLPYHARKHTPVQDEPSTRRGRVLASPVHRWS